MEKWARSDAVQAFRGFLQPKEPIESGSRFDREEKCECLIFRFCSRLCIMSFMKGMLEKA